MRRHQQDPCAQARRLRCRAADAVALALLLLGSAPAQALVGPFDAAEASVQDLADRLARAAGTVILLDPAIAAQPVSLHLDGPGPWLDAARRLAGAAGAELEVLTPGAIRLAPAPRVTLGPEAQTAEEALAAIARQSGQPIVVSHPRGVSTGPLHLSSDRRTWDRALAEVVRSAGLTLSPVGAARFRDPEHLEAGRAPDGAALIAPVTFREATVAEVAEHLARQAQLNILVDPDLSDRRVTLRTQSPLRGQDALTLLAVVGNARIERINDETVRLVARVLITLEVSAGGAHDVIVLICRLAGIDVVLPSDLEGASKRVSVYVRDAPADDVLQAVLDACGLVAVREGQGTRIRD